MFGLFAAPASDRRADDDDGARLVAAAAALLQIPDFRFFHLAHRRWYGEDATDEQIERAFVPYMYRRRVPFWARHLAREILESSRAGTLDPARYGVRPVTPRPEMRRKGALFGTVLVLVIYALCFVVVTYQPH